VLSAFTTAEFPASIGPLAVSTELGCLAGLSNENPDNIQIFDISDPGVPPVLLEQELLATDNPNGNGTGALGFGEGTLYGLGTNNGVLALSLNKEPGGPPDDGPFLSGVVLAGDEFQFTLSGEEGKTYAIDASADAGVSWTELTRVTLPGGGSQPFSFPVTKPAETFRGREVAP
jgi:hypothetical protein